jgi:hypothetical protein
MDLVEVRRDEGDQLAAGLEVLGVAHCPEIDLTVCTVSMG